MRKETIPTVIKAKFVKALFSSPVAGVLLLTLLCSGCRTELTPRAGTPQITSIVKPKAGPKSEEEVAHDNHIYNTSIYSNQYPKVEGEQLFSVEENEQILSAAEFTAGTDEDLDAHEGEEATEDLDATENLDVDEDLAPAEDQDADEAQEARGDLEILANQLELDEEQREKAIPIFQQYEIEKKKIIEENLGVGDTGTQQCQKELQELATQTTGALEEHLTEDQIKKYEKILNQEMKLFWQEMSQAGRAGKRGPRQNMGARPDAGRQGQMGGMKQGGRGGGGGGRGQRRR